MLGIDRVIRHRRVEPEAVALLTVVERALERTGLGSAAAASAPLGRGGRRLFLLGFAAVRLGCLSLAARLLGSL